MAFRPNVFSTKRLFDPKSFWPNVLLTKHLFDQMSFRPKVDSTKKSIWPNGFLPNGFDQTYLAYQQTFVFVWTIQVFLRMYKELAHAYCRRRGCNTSRFGFIHRVNLRTIIFYCITIGMSDYLFFDNRKRRLRFDMIILMPFKSVRLIDRL